MIMDSRFTRSWMVVLALGACGDDDASDSAGELGSASAEDGPEPTTSATQSEGSTSASDSATTTAGTSSTAGDDTGTQGTGDTTGDGSGPTTGIGTDSGGTMVDSCDECSPDELCVELTEYAGPADGGGPTVSYTCHAVPPACGDTITCECAGFLCPGDGGGAEGMCSTDGEVLQCSVAYP